VQVVRKVWPRKLLIRALVFRLIHTAAPDINEEAVGWGGGKCDSGGSCSVLPAGGRDIRCVEASGVGM
jgi:hypothetical protein